MTKAVAVAAEAAETDEQASALLYWMLGHALRDLYAAEGAVVPVRRLQIVMSGVDEIDVEFTYADDTSLGFAL